MAIDVVVNWVYSVTPTVTGYRVTFTRNGTMTSQEPHAATETFASYLLDGGPDLVAGDVVGATVAAYDALQQFSTDTASVPPTVTVPSTPDPPTGVTLILGST